MKRFSLRQFQQLDAIYSRLPKLQCKGLCQQCCGPIAMTKLEYARLSQRVGAPPKSRADHRCPMLGKDGRCRVYEIRPAICRLYGLVPEMKCPHGCEPERWLSPEEGKAFILDVHRVGGGVATQLSCGFIPIKELIARGPR